MVTHRRNGNTEFRFYRPAAQGVTLVDDFNGWNLTSLPMTRNTDGWWRCQIRITPGCYHFRYLSDGEWFMDYAAFGLDYGPHGLDSVVNVESPPAAAAVLTLMRSRAARSSNGRGNEGHQLAVSCKPGSGSACKRRRKAPLPMAG